MRSLQIPHRDSQPPCKGEKKNMTSAISNANDFFQQLQGITIEEDKILVSYDMKSLYISSPIDEALDSIMWKPTQNDRVQDQTPIHPFTRRSPRSRHLPQNNEL